MEEPCILEWPTALPMPGLPPPHVERRDAAAHRHAILETARRLFAQQGVEAVSMRQIAQEAGIGQGTLYRRYPNKVALGMDLMLNRHMGFIARLGRHLQALATAPALEQLDAVLDELMAFLEESEAYLTTTATAFKLEQWQQAAHQRHGELPYKPIFVWLNELFAALLNLAVAQHEIASIDVPLTADLVLAALNPVQLRQWRQQRGYPPERIVAAVRQIYR